jgi:hypothetical protein
VRQEVADGDVALAVAFEAGNVGRDAVIQPDPPVLHKHHHGRRGGHDLGERGEVEDRVQGHRLGRRFDGAPPERLLVEDLVAAADDHDGPRQLSRLDRFLHDRGNRLEARGVQALPRRRRTGLAGRHGPHPVHCRGAPVFDREGRNRQQRKCENHGPTLQVRHIAG